MNDEWSLVVDVIRKRTQADVKSCEEEIINDLRDNPLEYTQASTSGLTHQLIKSTSGLNSM